MNYLDRIYPDQREALMEPSRHMIRFRAFVAAYRSAHPEASMQECHDAYVASCAAR